MFDLFRLADSRTGSARRTFTARSKSVGAGLTLTLAMLGLQAIADPAENTFDGFPAALSQPEADPRDRLEILNLIHVYSHLADGLHTELFGEFFTEDASFEIVQYDAKPDDPKQVMKSRAEIVESMRPRHALFRQEKMQRRHFLTNPIVWDQTQKSARVAVYLQLHSITDGGPPGIVATGRYEGRAVKTAQGWRMAEWRIFSDQRLE